MKAKWMKWMIFGGMMECKDHSYAWSGKMPCTGVYRCVFCGKQWEDQNERYDR